jgi:putative ABC transport system permease protein
MMSVVSSLRPIVRGLSRNRGFTLAAVLTLAFGLGANIAVLSAGYGVLVKPLPYRNAERLALIRAEADYEGSNRPARLSVQAKDVQTWQQSAVLLKGSALYATASSALTVENGSEILNTAVVSSEFFALLDGPLVAGRPIGEDEDGSPVAVISERLAQRLFGGIDGALGRALQLKPHTYTVVGVAGRAFDFPTDQVDAWLPAGFSRTTNPSCCSFEVIARLPQNTTLEAAGAEARTLFQSLPSAGGNPGAMRVRATWLGEESVAPVRPALLVLSAAAGLLLLVACGNVMNLLLARNATREAEFAIRKSLGAPARTLISQIALEGAVLTLGGGAAGLVIASGLLSLMANLAGVSVPRLEGLQINWMSVLIGLSLSAIATIGTTIVPALRVIHGPSVPPRSGDRAGRPGGMRTLQRAMCAMQVAMAVTLLIGATVMNRSLLSLLNVDLGVSKDHVVTASLNLAFGERLDDAQTLLRIDRVVGSMAATPGVRAIGAGAAIPPHLARMQVTLRRRDAAVDYRAAAVPATPGYFSALQLRLREGRFFTEEDIENAAPVMIMSEGTARRFFGEKPIGQTMTVPRLRNGRMDRVDVTLVGVVQNVKYSGLAAPPDDVIYVPLKQQPWRSVFLVVRTDAAPEAFAANLRKTITSIEPTIVVGEVATLDQLVSGQVAGPRFRTVLLSVIAILALGIAAVGLYGMVSYSVEQRTREVGIRVVIGATARDIVTMIMRETLFVGGLGIVLGLGVALYAANLLAGLLYGVAPTDPASFLLASGGLLGVTAIAGYLPARRASRMSPTEALRAE